MNDLLKQIRREFLPIFDEIIKAMGGTPIPAPRTSNSGGLKLVKQIRKEFGDRLTLIKSLAISKSSSIPPAPPAPAPTRSTTRKTKADPKPDGDTNA